MTDNTLPNGERRTFGNRYMNEERDKEICRLYLDGVNLDDLGRKFDKSSERIRQILKKAGIYKNAKLQKVGLRAGVVVSQTHDEFLGLNLTEDDKELLRLAAEKDGLSMAALTRSWIKEKLKERSDGH